MTKKAARRRTYRAVEVKEPVKSGFTPGNLVNLGAIPILTAILTGIGFYYSTTSKLDLYAREISTIQKVVGEKTTEDNVQREKIREAFLVAQTKTNDGISKLDTRLAVAETNQKVANDALKQINETLQKISAFALDRGRGR